VPPISEPPFLVIFATIGSNSGASISKVIFLGMQVMIPGSPFAAVTKENHGPPNSSWEILHSFDVSHLTLLGQLTRVPSELPGRVLQKLGF
jgi:hypothetical protein